MDSIITQIEFFITGLVAFFAGVFVTVESLKRIRYSKSISIGMLSVSLFTAYYGAVYVLVSLHIIPVNQYSDSVRDFTLMIPLGLLLIQRGIKNLEGHFK